MLSTNFSSNISLKIISKFSSTYCKYGSLTSVLNEDGEFSANCDIRPMPFSPESHILWGSRCVPPFEIPGPLGYFCPKYCIYFLGKISLKKINFLITWMSLGFIHDIVSLFDFFLPLGRGPNIISKIIFALSFTLPHDISKPHIFKFIKSILAFSRLETMLESGSSLIINKLSKNNSFKNILLLLWIWLYQWLLFLKC